MILAILIALGIVLIVLFLLLLGVEGCGDLFWDYPEILLPPDRRPSPPNSK